RLGLVAANDRLPEPILESLPDGGAEGYVIPFDEMLSAYYTARGWDAKSGKPTSEKLESLGLSDIAEDIW
ncbi:MAG: aldehyde ferredoxin oxidoreductase, partial [Anaerolineales bacterium]|nr:aldehyde ferredoxin oxidoreductase [Candidatus Desulfolinea nitratireducens]